MFVATEMTVSISRACGHQELQTIRYKGTDKKNSMLLAARQQVCLDCKTLVKGWFENPLATPFDLSLPTLKGSDKQVSWANKIRAQHAIKLLMVLSLAISHRSTYAESVAKSIALFLTYTKSSFWIEHKDRIFSTEYFCTEASYFQSTSLLGISVSPHSVFGLTKREAPHLIEFIDKVIKDSFRPIQNESNAV